MPARAAQEHVVHPDASFSLLRFSAAELSFLWHAHPEYELTYLTAGTGRRFVGDHVGRYGPGDLVLLGPHLPHSWLSDPGPPAEGEAVVVRFRADFLGDAFLALPEFQVPRSLLDLAGRGLAYPRSVVALAGPRLLALADGPPLERLLALLGVLGILGDRHAQAAALAGAGYRPDQGDTARRRMEAIVAYLGDHHGRPLPLGEVAAVAHMTPSAFSRAFHRATGRTFTDHLTELRIGTASRRLLETDDPVSTIAADSGFANLSNFNRRFRERRGMAPREFRRLHQATGPR